MQVLFSRLLFLVVGDGRYHKSLGSKSRCVIPLRIL